MSFSSYTENFFNLSHCSAADVFLGSAEKADFHRSVEQQGKAFYAIEISDGALVDFYEVPPQLFFQFENTFPT